MNSLIYLHNLVEIRVYFAVSARIICIGSDASALGNCTLPRTGISRIGKLQLAYDSMKVVVRKK